MTTLDPSDGQKIRRAFATMPYGVNASYALRHHPSGRDMTVDDVVAALTVLAETLRHAADDNTRIAWERDQLANQQSAIRAFLGTDR